MKRTCSMQETVALKCMMRERRLADEKAIGYRDKGKLSKDVKRYCNNDFVDRVYPLLDPELTNYDERMEKHYTFFEDGQKANITTSGEQKEGNIFEENFD